MEDFPEPKGTKRQRQKAQEAEILCEENDVVIDVVTSPAAQLRQSTTVTFQEEENEYVEMNVEDNGYSSIIEDEDSEEEGEISFTTMQPDRKF